MLNEDFSRFDEKIWDLKDLESKNELKKQIIEFLIEDNKIIISELDGLSATNDQFVVNVLIDFLNNHDYSFEVKSLKPLALVLT